MRVRERLLPLLSIPLFLCMILFLAACSGTEEATHEEVSAPLEYGGGYGDIAVSDGDGYSYDMSAAPLEPSTSSSPKSIAASSERKRDAGPSSLSAGIVREGSVSTEGAGVGLRGGRASEASVRVDALSIVAPPVVADGSSSFVVASPVDATTTGKVDDAMLGRSGGDLVEAIEIAGESIAAEKDVAEVEDLPVEDVPVVEEPTMDAGQLTAGEWSDLREWKFWNAVSASNDWKNMKGHWGFGAGQRISVRVDNGSQPIPDAEVKLLAKDGTLLWTARSDNHGRAELFTGLDAEKAAAPYDIVVSANGKESRIGSVDPSREQGLDESPLVARLQTEPKAPKTIDVMFMIDATGSMGDEMSYIKGELVSVINRVRDDLDEDYTLRLSTNVYRDHGDEYVVRSTEFDTDIAKSISFLKKQAAGGGGDIPEAVEDALEDAIENHEWSDAAQSRFLFLVLDAPPHYDAERTAKIRALTEKAAAKGIRIIPVASSGIDKETEFLLRFMGIHTGGTYVFLTDHSGIGNSHIEPTIGDYAVEYLDDLIVRLIVQYTERPLSLDAITPRLPAIK